MKHAIKSALAFAVLASLAGCGLRGDLERPPPVFSEPPSEEAKAPISAPVYVAGTQIDQDRAYFNAIGGEIPKPAPTNDIEEGTMGEVSPG